MGVVSLVVMDTGEVECKVLRCCFEGVFDHHGNSERPHPSRDGGDHPSNLTHLGRRSQGHGGYYNDIMITSSNATSPTILLLASLVIPVVVRV